LCRPTFPIAPVGRGVPAEWPRSERFLYLTPCLVYHQTELALNTSRFQLCFSPNGSSTFCLFKASFPPYALPPPRRSVYSFLLLLCALSASFHLPHIVLLGSRKSYTDTYINCSVLTLQEQISFVSSSCSIFVDPSKSVLLPSRCPRRSVNGSGPYGGSPPRPLMEYYDRRTF